MNAKKIPLLMVLLIAAIGAVVFSWRQTHPSSSASPESVTNDGSVTERADALLSTVQTQIEGRAKQLETVDWPEKVVIPEAPPEAVEETTETPVQKPLPRFTGVAQSGGQAIAFLDGRLIAVGESMDGYEVVEIANESVVLRDANGEKTTLRLYGSH